MRDGGDGVCAPSTNASARGGRIAGSPERVDLPHSGADTYRVAEGTRRLARVSHVSCYASGCGGEHGVRPESSEPPPSFLVRVRSLSQDTGRDDETKNTRAPVAHCRKILLTPDDDDDSYDGGNAFHAGSTRLKKHSSEHKHAHGPTISTMIANQAAPIIGILVFLVLAATFDRGELSIELATCFSGTTTTFFFPPSPGKAIDLPAERYCVRDCEFRSSRKIKNRCNDGKRLISRSNGFHRAQLSRFLRMFRDFT